MRNTLPISTHASTLIARIVILAILVSTLVVGIVLARFPGLQYDETLFVNAATRGGAGSLSADFVVKRFHGIPVLLMDYIGALKSWIYTPIFAVFGVSVLSVRIPMIVMFCVAVGISCAVVWRHSGPWIAVLCAVLLCSDPVFALMTRADWGPAAIAGFFRVLALYALLRALDTQRLRWIWVLVAALSFGVFNKLDFTIFTFALLLASVVVLWPRWFALSRNSKWRIVPPVIVLAVVYVLAYAYMYLPSQQSAQPPREGLISNIEARWSLVAFTFQGTFLSQYMTGQTVSIGSWMFPVALCLTVIAVIVILIKRVKSDRHRLEPPIMSRMPIETVFIFVSLTAVFVFIIMVFVPEISGPHHAIILWPAPQLLASLALAYLVQNRSIIAAPVRFGLLAFVSLALIGAMVSQGILSVELGASLRNGRARSAIWSDEPAAVAQLLSNRMETAGTHTVLVADWGIGNQLMALSEDRAHMDTIDNWGAFAQPINADPEAALTALGVDPASRFYLVGHNLAAQIIPNTTANRNALVAECLAAGGSSKPIYSGHQVVVIQLTCQR